MTWPLIRSCFLFFLSFLFFPPRSPVAIPNWTLLTAILWVFSSEQNNVLRFSLVLRSKRERKRELQLWYLYFCPFALYCSLITTCADVLLKRIFQKGSFILQRRDNHLHSQHPDLSSGRLRNLFDIGSHRPGTANAGVRGRQERTWSRVSHISRGRSQATGRFIVGHYILHYATRKKFLFRRRNRL